MKYDIAAGQCGTLAHSSDTDKYPVTSVSWYDVIKWCNALSEYEGRTPCYYTTINKNTVFRDNEISFSSSQVDWNADGYRLPTEAEWEYACRAKNNASFYWGESYDETVVTQYAWCISNSYNDGLGTSYARYRGELGINDFGLYDMMGNVAEWIWDKAENANLYSNDVIGIYDPKGTEDGVTRVLRGGSYKTAATSLRSSLRTVTYPASKTNYIGLRVAAKYISTKTIEE